MLLPSHFNSFRDFRPRPVTWKEIHALITSTTNDVYTKTRLSREARAKGDIKTAAELKSSMGFFTPAVQMKNGRKVENIVAFTGECMCDFDHISKNHINLLVERVSRDPHTRLCHITNSEEGLRIVFRWNLTPTLSQGEGDVENSKLKDEKWFEEFFTFTGVDPETGEEESHEAFMERCLPYHQRAWEMGNLYYQRLLDGAEIDEHCKDPNRISFYCHDLHAYYNEDPEAFNLEDETLFTPKEALSHLGKAGIEVIENSEIDESIITHLLELQEYKPSNRHAFWVTLGMQVKYYGHQQTQLYAYKEAALRILGERHLILPDDPSIRKANEIEESMKWGFEKGKLKIENSRLRNQSGASFGEEEVIENSKLRDGNGKIGDEENEDDVISHDCPLFPDEVYQNLPKCLLDGLAPVLDFTWNSETMKPETISFKEKMPRRRADALLLSLLTNYSVLCSNTHLLYGDRDYSPNLGFLCLAPAGNGKSVIEYGFRIIESTDRYLEKISNEEHKAWQEQMDAYEQGMHNGSNGFKGANGSNGFKGANGSNGEKMQRPGDEPQMRMLAMPGTTSRSQFTICMNAMGQSGLIMNSTEINTLISTLKLDVGNFVDLLCKAMMNEQITQFFKIDNKPIKIKHPKLSVCMSGTFDQFHNFIRSIEDGLYSRFLILMMEQHTVWISQKPDPKRGDYSDVYNRLSDDALEMWLMLNDNPTWTTFTDEQWDEHTRYFTAETEELVREGSGDRAAILNRHGLGQMRIASVLTVLRKWEKYSNSKLKDENGGLQDKGDFKERYRVMVCRDDDYHTAKMITDCLLPHALHLSTTMMADRPRNVQPMRQWRWVDAAYDCLPGKFTIKDWLSVAKQLGRSESQGYRSIRKMVEHGKVREKCENSTRTYCKSKE